MALGINPETIVRAQFKEYVDSLGDQGNAFVTDMTSSVGTGLQQQIDKAEQLLSSVQTGAQSLITGTVSWVISAVSADPMAPVASAGVIASTIGAVQSAKGLLGTLTNALAELTGMLNNWRIPLPAPVAAAANLLNAAGSALNSLPI